MRSGAIEEGSSGIRRRNRRSGKSEKKPEKKPRKYVLYIPCIPSKINFHFEYKEENSHVVVYALTRNEVSLGQNWISDERQANTIEFCLIKQEFLWIVLWRGAPKDLDRHDILCLRFIGKGSLHYFFSLLQLELNYLYKQFRFPIRYNNRTSNWHFTNLTFIEIKKISKWRKFVFIIIITILLLLLGILSWNFYTTFKTKNFSIVMEKFSFIIKSFHFLFFSLTLSLLLLEVFILFEESYSISINVYHYQTMNKIKKGENHFFLNKLSV